MEFDNAKLCSYLDELGRANANLLAQLSSAKELGQEVVDAGSRAAANGLLNGGQGGAHRMVWHMNLSLIGSIH